MWRKILPLLFILAPALPVPAAFAGFPDTVVSGGTSFSLAEAPRTYSRDDMYLHINGEAELLKRYGAVSLSYALYRAGQGGGEVTVDILDMGRPENAYGLFRLYSGCEPETRVEWVAGGQVLLDEFTTYARFGRYFFRLDPFVDAGAKAVAEDVLRRLFADLCPDPLPAVIAVLEDAAAAPCRVQYHPEAIDYDLESGPGYRWEAADSNSYYLRILGSERAAGSFARELGGRLNGTVTRSGRVVLWWGGGIGPARTLIEKIAEAVGPGPGRGGDK